MARGFLWLVLTLVAGCVGAGRREPVRIDEAAPPPSNTPPPEPTLATAGGPCETEFDLSLGRATAGMTGVAFGARGGLAAWRSGAKLTVQPLAKDGRLVGRPHDLAVSFNVAALLASGTGFLLVAQGSKCAGRVVASRSGGSGTGGAGSVTCEFLGPVHVVVAALEQDGTPRDHAEVVLDEPVAAIAGGHRGHWAMVTADGRWLDVHHRGGSVSLAEHPVRIGKSVLPVRGVGRRHSQSHGDVHRA